jgi:putative ABC transport system permease protein
MISLMTGLLHDLRHALRGLRNSPGYSLTCVLVLALGIGVNAAIFTVVDSIVLRPLRYPELERLVFVWERFPGMPEPFASRFRVARRNFDAWRKEAQVFDVMAAFCDRSLKETGHAQPRQVQTAFVSANLFPLLAARPSLGRLFTPDEEREGSDRVAVLSDGYFQRRFHGDRGALGRSITLGDAAHTVIGVLPPRFHLPSTMQGQDQLKPEVWVPLSRLPASEERAKQLEVAARLAPGVSLAQARTEMAAIAERRAKIEPEMNEGFTSSVFPFSVEDAEPKLHRALLVLFGAVGFLLLIACANLANLTLARATLRGREVAVRFALGASRARVVMLLLAESLLGSTAGAALGLLLAHWCVKGIVALEPPDIQRPELIGMNLGVFLFGAAAAVATSVLFGLAPALAVAGIDLNLALKSGAGASAARMRSRQLLIAVEVALAFVLLSGAGLMIRSFRELVATGVGFRTSHLMTVDVELPETRYPDAARRSRFYVQLLERVRALGGIRTAAVVDNLPLHSVSFSNFYIAGRPEPPITALPMADYASVSPDYFGAIGLPLLSGRFFTESDLAPTGKQQTGVAIVNREFVHKFFDQENPLGQRLLGQDRKNAAEIVGVVADYRPMGAENGTRPQIFRPGLDLRSASLIARTSGDPANYAAALQNAIWAVDKDLPVNKVETMDHYVSGSQATRKYYTLLLSIFSALALALAAMGVFGVLSNLVASRVREIGIRMAIGARPSDIGRLVVRQTMIPVSIGLALGLAGSLLLGRFLEALLFQVQPRDPATLLAAAAAILVVSPAAIVAPLRRATRVDCTVALRAE